MSKKLLLIGDGNSQFIYNLAKWLRKYGDFSTIDMWTFSPVRQIYLSGYDNIYTFSENINTFGGLVDFTNVDSIKSLIQYLKNLYRRKKFLSHFPKYDYVHTHYLHPGFLYKADLFRCKKIFTIWGSDFYRADNEQKKHLSDVYKKANYLTFANIETKKDFSDQFTIKEENVKICRFGLAPLEYLKNIQETKMQSKRRLGWNTDKLSVTVGYNMNRAQRHIQILDIINGTKELKDKIELIVPITYGGSEEYKAEIISKLESLDVEFKVYDQYLDDETVSQLRNASDIMIQLQTTDQFSGSMQEHLFTRNVVITGSWLPYQTMIDYGVNFEEIDCMDFIGSKLIDVVNNYYDYYQKTVNNQEAISKLSSWNNTIQSWLELYK